MDKKLYLNRIAVWLACGDKDFDILPQPPRPVIANGIVRVQQTNRMKKDYKIGKGKSAVKFSVFIYTDIDVKEAGAQIDAAVKSFADDEIKRYLLAPNNLSFSWTDKYIGGK